MSLITSVLTGGKTKTIPLSGGKEFALVDEADFEYLNQWKWKLSSGRAVRTKHVGTVGDWRNGKRKDVTIHMHRLVMDAPEGLEVDHIDGNPLNNQKSNLRLCSHEENRRNNKMYASNKSGFKGVSYSARHDKWITYIRFMNKSYNLGIFSDRIEAALEYDNVARQLFGEYARVNFGDKE